MASSNNVLKLYKTMLRESQKFLSYNYRTYALRRVRDGFKAGKSLTDSTQISDAIKDAEEALLLIKRQTLVGGLYEVEKLVIEKHQMRELASKVGAPKS